MNIIHICIDALCYNDLFNNKYNVAPNILDFASSSIVFHKYLSNAGPTQFALPSVFSSTFPLDYGGYDNGVKNRPITLPQTLKDFGYKNYFIGANAWINKKEGYLDGIDTYIDANDPKLFWDNSKIYFEYNKKRHINGRIDIKELFEITFQRAKIDLERTLNSIENIKNNIKGKDSFVIRSYTKNKIRNDFNKFFAKYSSEKFEPSLENISRLIDFDYILNLNKPILIRLKNRVSRKFHSYYHNGAFLVKKVIQILKDNNTDNKYIYLHLYDIHERNYNNTNFQKIGVNSNKFLKKIGCPKRVSIEQKLKRSIDDKLKIAMSIRYVDDQIGRLIHYIKKEEQLNNTLIVLNADHGLGGFSSEKKEQLTGSLYNDYLHVPCMIFAPNKPKYIMPENSLFSHIDIFPTILDCLELPIPKGIKGKSMFKKNEKGKVSLFENASLGPCDLVNGKPIKIAFIKNNFKSISVINPQNHKYSSFKLFNLKKDWYEKHDLSNDVYYTEIVNEFKRMTISRVQEITDQGKINN
jgi:arylsulfatase A-like enzyme